MLSYSYALSGDEYFIKVKKNKVGKLMSKQKLFRLRVYTYKIDLLEARKQV